ncbi:FAD-binding oxidoreductase [Modestobacter sp. L9-4]|uniref:FAD-binding oxidoreductase n=1 Tax=Modestobacter sp. L9-4 TaxID=2851567 RepID=UPI001C7524F1|nr:FAD-binding oxidoreductase [Modestobacter sp. L9-4]QXG74546.1 FAD-binding oxidoreductase [Modestobacter sp. L9-4]
MADRPEPTDQGTGPTDGRAATGAGQEGTAEGRGPTSDADLAGALPKAARRHLARELDWTPRSTPPVPLEQVQLSASRLAPAARVHLVALLGAEHVADDRATRLAHTGGRSYLDLLRRRVGDASDAPDVVVSPADTAQVAALLHTCSQLGVVVVPYGGGGSGVGGLAGTDADDRPVVAVDLHRMADVSAIDAPSSLVTVGPGLHCSALETRLATDGLTLGAAPEGWGLATVGGCAASRSAAGHGHFADLVTGLTLATPTGVLTLGTVAGGAAGPDLLGLALGSEGTLGVVTELQLRVRPAPRRTEHEGWSFRSWAAGVAAVARLARHDLLPDVVRLADPAGTRATLLQGRGPGARALRTRMRGESCLLVVGWSGQPTIVAARRAAAATVLRESGATRQGTRSAAAWLRARGAAPELRDRLMDAGLLVAELDTAATWTRLPAVAEAARRALVDQLSASGRRPMVLTTLSSPTATGAALELTVLADRDDDLPLQQWLLAKRAATDAVLAAGGTLTHHSGVGADHRPWLTAAVGAPGVEVLRAVKRQLDPAGICHPGVLLPD